MKKAPITIIRYSCVNDQAVWIYVGPTKVAAKQAYYRTVQRERKRQRQWGKVQRQRSANISRLLDNCIAAMPIVGDLTREQREAITTLRTMADNPPEFCSPLLEHDRERRHQYRLKLRRQRYWRDADYRQQNKARLRQRRQQMKQEENSR